MSLTLPNGRKTSPIEPRNEIEAAIADIFCEILQCESVSTTDSFFDLGGRSLGTISLLAKIEAQFGVKIHLSSLIDSPTVAHLASLICSPPTEPSGPLVPFRRAGSRLPLFCVHGVGGSAAPFGELSAALGVDQPFYGLQATVREDGRAHHTRLEDMASHYISQIRQVQPRGPYSVAGWSSGGVVAFEIARQLSMAGENVALLGLLDTNAPVNLRLQGIGYALTELLNRAKKHFEVWKRSSMKDKLLYGVNSLKRRRRSKVAEASIQANSDSDNSMVRGDVVEALVIAERGYRPLPYSGSAVLFKTESLSAEYPNDQTLGWDKLIRGGLTIHNIPGDHYTIMTAPHVQVIAEFLCNSMRVFIAVALLSAPI